MSGLLFIAGFESLRTEAYLDPVGIPTICYGSTKNVGLGLTKTKEECWELLEKEAREFSDGVVESLPYLVVVSQDELDAYTSFAYNVGLGAWNTSTLLKKLKRGDREGACNELPRWVYADGKRLNGLVRRRADEQTMCLRGAQYEVENYTINWSFDLRQPLHLAH